MTTLDLARIQGFVVRGYRLPFARYLFLRVDDVARAAAWIAETTAEVLTAAPWDDKPDSGVNVAFSYSGLRALQLPDASLAGFPEEFRQGMAARANLLGDYGESDPSNWEGGFGGPDIHALVMISAKHQAAMDAHDARVRAGLEANGGLTIVYEDVGAALPGGVEHFGYADGFAQPSIEGSTIAPTPGQGAPSGNGDWRPIRAGEFILGYTDEEGVAARGATARGAEHQRLVHGLPQASPGRCGVQAAARGVRRSVSGRRRAACRQDHGAVAGRHAGRAVARVR